MDKYSVKMTSRARRDLDSIYYYIAHTLLEPRTALCLVNRIEEAILELDQMPYRCPERNRGIYAYQGYREFLVENYTAIYRVDEEAKTVVIITVQYSARNF